MRESAGSSLSAAEPAEMLALAFDDETLARDVLGFELDVEDGADLPYGQAMKVRFDLGTAPLAVQLWRSATIWYEKLMLSRYINQGS